LAVHSRPPVSLTSLVGRERELTELHALLAAQRLVTVTGMGGSGKTRLAAELALRIDWQRVDSVGWVELGPCGDPQLVPQRAAVAMSLTAPQCGAVDALIEALREREFLLVLDNCEHVVAAAAELARTLLLRCPRLRILATSREPLGVAGERVWPVPPIAHDDAVKLFSERATAVDPSFALTAENNGAVAEICRRLDSIPLAIELAAARVRVLTPEQIAAKLGDRFAILTGGARTADPRHRTLRAAIDWSFALLSEREQTLLARLSVFAGSFTLEAAEAVCGADLDLLTGLVDKSLVTTKSRRAAIRYQLLDTIRQYAFERLEAGGASCEVLRRHALAYLEFAREWTVDPNADGVMTHLERLDAEHDNVRAAMSWSLEHEPDAIALPLAAQFRWYWYYRILWSEGLRWLTRAIERSSSALSPDRGATLAGAGAMAGYTGDLSSGRKWLEEAESMWRTLGDDRELALTLSALSQVLANAGELDAATARARESVALARTAGTPYDIAYCLTNAAAFVANRRGELEEADRALEEAEAIWSPNRHALGYPFVLSTRAVLAIRRGDYAAAARLARATLVESRALNYHWFSARALRVLAFTTADRPRAARLLGAADAMLRTIGARVLMHEESEQERLVASLQDLTDEIEAGRGMCVEDAYELGLASEEVPAARETPALHVSDLGPLQITLGGKPIATDRASNRARELLAFLLAHPPGPTKEEVGVAFWPDATSEQVKNSFHVTLHRLRKLLGGSESIVVDGARYRVALPHAVDSLRFESEVAIALRQNDTARLESALSLYTGDFLQGEDAGEWCLPIRARLRQLYVRGLFAHGQAQEARGRFTDAAETYSRVLARDPFHEPAARQLMICHARLGARSESLSVYRQLEQRLRDDLQTEPEPETASLYRELRYRTENAAK
jgi:predicted ATPase/DNA-binding SARP family transcriptional activator